MQAPAHRRISTSTRITISRLSTVSKQARPTSHRITRPIPTYDSRGRSSAKRRKLATFPLQYFSVSCVLTGCDDISVHAIYTFCCAAVVIWYVLQYILSLYASRCFVHSCKKKREKWHHDHPTITRQLHYIKYEITIQFFKLQLYCFYRASYFTPDVSVAWKSSHHFHDDDGSYAVRRLLTHSRLFFLSFSFPWVLIEFQISFSTISINRIVYFVGKFT